MLDLKALKYLASQKQKDAEVLFKQGRKKSHIKPKKVKKNISIQAIEYVLPLGGNGWVVKNSKAAKFTVITDSKREAVSIARNLAKKKQIELVVYGRNGQVDIRENYTTAN